MSRILERFDINAHTLAQLREQLAEIPDDAEIVDADVTQGEGYGYPFTVDWEIKITAEREVKR